jgi:hypothetical protein
MKTKICTKCGTSREIEDFQENERYKDGRSTWCKACHKAASTTSRKRCADRDPDYHKNNALRKHGMTVESYGEQLREQGGHCALCPATESNNGDRLSVDHDHNCCVGKYSCEKCHRGLLCSTCNSRLGYLELLIKEGTVVPKEGTWTSLALQYLTQYATER